MKLSIKRMYGDLYRYYLKSTELVLLNTHRVYIFFMEIQISSSSAYKRNPDSSSIVYFLKKIIKIMSILLDCYTIVVSCANG